MRKILVDTSYGVPAIWEEGGAMDPVPVRAIIVADANGDPCVPLHVPEGAHPYGKHALLPIQEGSLILFASRLSGIRDYVRVEEVVSIAERWHGLDTQPVLYAMLNLVNVYYDGVWVMVPRSLRYEHAARVALQKSVQHNGITPCFVSVTHSRPVPAVA